MRYQCSVSSCTYQTNRATEMVTHLQEHVDAPRKINIVPEENRSIVIIAQGGPYHGKLMKDRNGQPRTFDDKASAYAALLKWGAKLPFGLAVKEVVLPLEQGS